MVFISSSNKGFITLFYDGLFLGQLTLLTPGFGSELQRMKLSGIHVQVFNIIC